MILGALINHDRPDTDAEFAKLASMGLSTCQFVSWETGRRSETDAAEIKRCAAKYGVGITAFWCGWSGPQVWDFIDGPRTLGLVPTEYREIRVSELIKGADFAKSLGVGDIVTHAGFMPEDPNDPNYPGVVAAIKRIAEHCRENGQNFLFESGQETPTTLLRVSEDVGTGNVFVNLDAANLVLYGKANPVDALDTIGRYVKNLHAKDGFYPTDGRALGKEAPIGKGKVNFPALFSKLRDIGYDGPVTIEREIPDGNETSGIAEAKEYLEGILRGL